MWISKRQEWQIPEREATPEAVYLTRRHLLQAAGVLGANSLLFAAAGCYPAARNPAFSLDRPVTPEAAATGYNNFYEFGNVKEAVQNRVGRFQVSPWKVEVAGLCRKPRTYDLDTLLRAFPLEERLYRHRCVEAWSMAVPWTGFPLAALLQAVEPLPEAKYVRFLSVMRQREEPGIAEQPWYPWPYFEALRLDEAWNPLALVVTGLYGKPLPKQNGAPIRIVCPWKYGYKSAKSLVKIEFVATQPNTFWNKLYPNEYSFLANVDPDTPHPRWSQATERLIPNMDVRPTLPFNGYGRYVAQLYQARG